MVMNRWIMTTLRLAEYLTITGTTHSEFTRLINSKIRATNGARFVSRQSVDQWVARGDYAWVDCNIQTQEVLSLDLRKSTNIFRKRCNLK